MYRILISLALLIAAMLIPAEGWVKLMLYIVPYLVVGGHVLWDALRSVFRGQMLDEDFLMAIATVGAFLVGEYTEGVAVMLFFQVGELFESYAVGKSRKSIANLMDIRPDHANVETENGMEEIDPEEVQPGSVIVIKPGERVPLDGAVIEGRTTLNTAALTGESLPREIQAEEEVISGCVNLTGLIRVRVTKPYEQSTVARILDLVENASSKKARMESFITRFARVYTPAVVLCAALLAVVPPLVDGNWSIWVYRALTFLVVSCPCALVISVPLSFFGGIGGASKKGILVKGSNYLEALAKCDTMVFDKTGTLTKGEFCVSSIAPVNVTKEEVLRLAAAAESYSDHPIAQGLRRACGEDIDKEAVTDVREYAGAGVVAVYCGSTLHVGNARLMRRLGIEVNEEEAAGTTVHAAKDGQYIGCIALADVVKDGASEAIGALKAVGSSRTVMLTGDRAAAAQSVAKQLGIDDVRAQLLPEDKVTAVEALLDNMREGRTLAFVGDGINDAPVLSRADVGIAMGALGSDAAIEAADVVLMDDDPRKIALAMRIAKKTLRIVKQNIAFALGVKGLVLILGALGRANLWLAVFADVGVAVLAILNAMRALRVEE